MKNIQFIQKIFFTNSPIQIKENLEGSLYQNDTLFLGCKAGPSIDEDNLLHEMAHFIEINDQRVKVSGWGLTYPEIEVLGQVFNEPSTTQGLMREIRVFAIQKHLMDICGLSNPNYFNEKSIILEWLQDYILIPTERDYRKEWCVEQIQKYYDKYSSKKIFIEWIRKNNLLTHSNRILNQNLLK